MLYFLSCKVRKGNKQKYNVVKSLRSTEKETKETGTHSETLEVTTLTSKIPHRLNVSET